LRFALSWPLPLSLQGLGTIVLEQIPLNLAERKKSNSVAFSPQANYTDRTTAACWRKLVSTFASRGWRVVSATAPHGR
jgi:hypothetical protein